jgi:hypothetical protein
MPSYTDEQVLAQYHKLVRRGQPHTAAMLDSLLAERFRLQAALDAVSKVAIDLETDAEIVQARNQKLSNTLKACAKEIRRTIDSARAKKEDV